MRTRAGFERLLSALEPAIQNIARQKCPNDLDVEAIIQEARMHLYIHVFEKRKVNLSYPSNTIRAWLHCEARNAIVNHLRHHGKKGMFARGGNKKGETVPQPDIVPLEHYAMLSRVCHDDAIELPWPLPLYLEFYEKRGTLIGAAEWIEVTRGFCRRKVEAAFKRVVAQMRGRR